MIFFLRHIKKNIYINIIIIMMMIFEISLYSAINYKLTAIEIKIKRKKKINIKFNIN